MKEHPIKRLYLNHSKVKLHTIEGPVFPGMKKRLMPETAKMFTDKLVVVRERDDF